MVVAESKIQRKEQLSATREGAWLVNISKHLVGFAPNSLGLAALGNVFFAGKCGALLIKLSADETEQLNRTKVKAHAHVCGIGGAELQVYLDTLRSQECLDWDSDTQVYEVLPFSRERVLDTASRIFASLLDTSAVEKMLPALLEFCLLRPRLYSEAKEFLTTTLTEKDANHLLELVGTFNLLGVEVLLGSKVDKLLYNEYQFGDKQQAIKIGSAVSNLPPTERAELSELLQIVAGKPGTPPESVKVSEQTKAFAIGLGLIEVSEVASPAGSAKFLTMPRLPVPSVGTQAANLEDDVFHHSKMLLSSLRFGELKSSRSRGQILEPYILVSMLLDRDRVGPCTAIGQDYVILEAEGVINTVRADHLPGNQFYMELRRREPAEVVKNLLKADVGSAMGAVPLSTNWQLPLHYTGPEAARPVAARTVRSQSPEAFRRFLEELRT